MNKLSNVLILVGLMILCSSVSSEDTTVQKQDTVKAESGLPIECVNVILRGRDDIGVLAADSKGDIYVNGGHQLFEMNKIKIFNPMGEKEREFVLYDSLCPPPHNTLSYPATVTGMDVDLDDNIYLANGGHCTIEKFTRAGEFLQKIIPPPRPKPEWFGIRDVAVDEDGTIYAVIYFKFVYIFDKDGKLLRKWAKSGKEDDQYGCLITVAVDKHKKSKVKRIYLGDNGTSKVYVFSKKDRRFLFSFGKYGSESGALISIMDMDVDSEGYVYVLDRSMGWCSVFNTEGKFVFRFGHEEVGDKWLYFPMGIFIDQDDRIYISNSGKSAILVYEWKQDRKKF